MVDLRELAPPAAHLLATAPVDLRHAAASRSVHDVRNDSLIGARPHASLSLPTKAGKLVVPSVLCCLDYWSKPVLA